MTVTEGARFTLDTNILVYAFDPAATKKQAVAKAILRAAARADCFLTRQSLTEFYAVVTRKRLLGRNEAATQVADWMALFPTLPLGEASLARAVAEAAAGRLSIWDGTLLAAAEEGGCSLCLSEDMGEGTRLGGIEVRSPFGTTGAAPIVQRLLSL